MSSHKRFKKLKDLFRPREQGKRHSQSSANTSRPQTPQSSNVDAGALSAQSSSHESEYATGTSPILMAYQEPKSPDPKAVGLPVQSNLIAIGRVSPSIEAPYPVNVRDNSENSYRLASRSPSPHLQRGLLHDTPAMDESYSLQSAIFREGSFANAHNITIYNANMNEGITTEDWRFAEEQRKAREERTAEEVRRAREEKRSEKEKKAEEERCIVEEKQAKEALEKFAARGMPGAMLNSKERVYAPKCDEETRKTLRTRILHWVQEESETRVLLWLSGPAAVGKSAVAQTVAEELKKEGLLGAVFFFSRPNNRSDPDVVIPTLVYQLALLLPEYRRIVVRQLVKNPLLLNENRRCQFENLIIDPFLSLMTQSLSQAVAQRPILIVLDGLDECNDREAQNEFVEMISHHACKEGSGLWLRWMICSRPEPDLKVAFSSADCKAICLEERLEVDDSEAQKDARRILDKGFAEIRKKYPDQVTEDWPAEDQVCFIADRASGHLGFASFIIRFIGDKEYDDPSGQLDVCIRFLKRAGRLTDLNPLHALDLLYTQILSDIPVNILPTTQRILGLFIFYDNKHLTVAAHANFLGLNQASFYRSLQRLHSVISVPPVSDAKWRPIRIYHASFSDFLKDPARSGKFALEEGVVPYLDIALSGLKWLSFRCKRPSESVMPELIWMPPNTTYGTVLGFLCSFSFTPCWRACLRVPEDSRVTLIKALEKFDFNLDYKSWRPEETHEFANFIQWLTSLGPSQKTLAVIRGWSTGKNYSTGDSLIRHRVDDPYAFVAPFLEGVTRNKLYCIDLQLGRSNPFFFKLLVDSNTRPAFRI